MICKYKCMYLKTDLKIGERSIKSAPIPQLQSWKNGFQMRIEEIFCCLAYTIYIYAVFQCATNFMICLCIFLWTTTLTFFLFQNDKFWILKRNSSLFLVILNNFTRVSQNHKTVALDINIIHYICQIGLPKQHVIIFHRI